MPGVILTGALGARARYLLGRFVAERAGSPFPFGTFVYANHDPTLTTCEMLITILPKHIRRSASDASRRRASASRFLLR